MSAPRPWRRLPLTLSDGLLHLAAVLVFAVAGPATGAPLDPELGFELTARSVEYREQGELYIADGDVLIVQDAMRLSADWIAFSLATERGVASGRIRLDDGTQLVEAEFMHFDIGSLTGLIVDGRIDTGATGLLIRGHELMKHGEIDYRVKQGVFTACRCPEETDRPPWRIETRDADVELGGYGKARSSTVDVLGVPILWIPWMVYPVKTERETGLLFPEFAAGGRNGFQVGVPFFWAAREDLGIVFTPRYLQERGPKMDLDVDYVLGEHSWGRFYGAFLLDKTAGVDVTGFDRERWAVGFEHDQFLPAGWRAKADVKLVSDNLYLQDFDDYALYRRDPFLYSTLFGYNHFGQQGQIGAVGSLQYAEDIQSPPLLDRDPLLLQRLPDLSVQALRTRPALMERAGVVTSVDTRYSYFHSTGDFPLALLGLATGPDPFSVEGLPMLQNGHRFSLQPRIARPIELGGLFDLYPEVGYVETLYGGSLTGFDERGIFTARADLRTRLRGDLKWGALPEATHLVEPFVMYTWVRPRSQLGTPVYVPLSLTPQQRLRQLTPENRVLDPSDRVVPSNVIAAGLDNRFRFKEPGRRLGSVISELRLSFEHDTEEGDIGHLVLDGRGYYDRWLKSEFSASWDVERSRLDEGLAGLSLNFPSASVLSHGWAGVRYRFLRDVPAFTTILPQRVNQLDVGFGFRLASRLMLRYYVIYDVDDRSRLGSGGTIVYASKCRCWSIGLDVSEDRTHDVFFGIRYSITGIGDDGGDPFSAIQTAVSGFGP